MKIERLESPVMHYAWGETPADGGAYIADLLKQNPGDQPWAELWIGAHPQAPSVVKSTGKALNEMLQAMPVQTLGATLVNRGESTLPYLLKILCCSSVLSIQSHPDKASAVRLHREMPEAFPDDNHKPEVIYAISDFELMAGFRPLEDILSDVRTLTSLSGWAELLSSAPSLKDVVSALFQLPAAAASAMAEALLAETSGRGGRFALFRRLVAQYPGDCGVFFALLLNYMTLHPGEAIFVKANMPHAYVKGRGIECMANSNNVIRAGLTPKYVNRQLLLDTLEFASVTPDALKVRCAPTRFELACGNDFCLQVVQLAANEAVSLPAGKPAVAIIVEGEAVIVESQETVEAPRGSTWFAPANASGSIKAAKGKTLVAVAYN